MGEFHVSVPKKYTFREGWGVYFDGIYDDEERITEVHGGIVRITEHRIEVMGGVPCVQDENGTYRPVENFRELEGLGVDDTHDFRDRWFQYKHEAQEHLDDTLRRFKNPQPWESFVTFS